MCVVIEVPFSVNSSPSFIAGDAISGLGVSTALSLDNRPIRLMTLKSLFFGLCDLNSLTTLRV